MKNINKLNYSSDNKKNKNVKPFIISFATFVVILGAVSLLMFMKSLNFNLKNIISASDEITTEEVSETNVDVGPIEGGNNVIVLCNNFEGDLVFSFLIISDYEELKSEVVYIPVTLTASYAGSTSSLNNHFKSGGAEAYINAFKIYSGVDVDKYILVNETQFKNFIAKFEDVTVNVPEAINGNNAEGLILNKGYQNLTSDLLLKYIKYTDNYDKAKAFCNMLEVVFNKKNTVSLDKLFSYLANNSQTDISIIDYTNEKEKISAFMQNDGMYIPIKSLSDVIKVDENEK